MTSDRLLLTASHLPRNNSLMTPYRRISPIGLSVMGKPINPYHPYPESIMEHWSLHATLGTLRPS
jgi:hypothetical protein